MEELDKLLRTREHYETLLFDKDELIAELEQELAKYKDLQDRLGLENVDEFEWFVMLDLLTDNEKNMHILDLHRELAELKEKLSKATQFETPHIERFALVRYLAQKNEPYKIVNCYDCYRDKDYKIHYCFYNVKSMNFKLIEVFATEQEAQAKLRSLKDVYNRT